MTKGKTFHTTGARAWDTLARFSALQEFPRHLFQGSSACMECCLFQCAWWQQADQAFEAEESVVDSAAALLILLARPLPKVPRTFGWCHQWVWSRQRIQ